MDTTEEEDPCHGGGSTGDSAPYQQQESSSVRGHFSDLYPPDFVESWLQAGLPDPEIVEPTVGHVKPLWGSTSEEQAMKDPRFGPQNALLRFNASPGVYKDWHQTRISGNQESYPHHHATRQHLDFDALMSHHSSISQSHTYYIDHNHARYSSNHARYSPHHAGYSSGKPSPSFLNSGHSHLSNSGMQESSSWQQISDSDESKMPFQYLSDQGTPIQMSEDSQTSSDFSNLMGEVSDTVGNGQDGDGATDTLESRSSANASKLQEDERVAEPNLVTRTRRGRKEAANALEDESCKRCKCRRSQCLKLYCECFMAGLYCIDSCVCEGCYNNLDFEDILDAKRREIESRRPLAFGSKVVQQATGSPLDKAEGDGSEVAPTSKRHKRGCKCKKSQCLKGYCECYEVCN